MNDTMTKIDQARRLAHLACEAYLHDESDEAERLYTQAAEIYAGMGCVENEEEMRALAHKYGPNGDDASENAQPNLTPNANWQTRQRGSNDAEYQIYLACANDGKGGDITRPGRPLKTYDQWLNS